MKTLTIPRKWLKSKSGLKSVNSLLAAGYFLRLA